MALHLAQPHPNDSQPHPQVPTDSHSTPPSAGPLSADACGDTYEVPNLAHAVQSICSLQNEG